ncbi:MAG: hypothetical protein P4L53_03360 [Candidatus Obscuribacterales bacterium]|nr:hypothetical protein [Candidatus Obscuribacterales bacterium]
MQITTIELSKDIYSQPQEEIINLRSKLTLQQMLEKRRGGAAVRPSLGMSGVVKKVL